MSENNLDKIKNIVSEQLGVSKDSINLDSSLVEDLGADSLDTVELVMAFEEEFGVEIPDEQAQKITKIQDIVDYIEKNS